MNTGVSPAKKPDLFLEPELLLELRLNPALDPVVHLDEEDDCHGHRPNGPGDFDDHGGEGDLAQQVATGDPVQGCEQEGHGEQYHERVAVSIPLGQTRATPVEALYWSGGAGWGWAGGIITAVLSYWMQTRPWGVGWRLLHS